nr:MAG TPA: hypothetical protein [Caudoviricetes sp.]
MQCNCITIAMQMHKAGVSVCRWLMCITKSQVVT